MKKIQYNVATFLLILFTLSINAQESQIIKLNVSIDKVQALKDTLSVMKNKTDYPLFKNSFDWFAQVIDAQPILTNHDSSVLSAAYDTFCLTPEIGNCREYSSYLNRQRPLIIAWQSPADGTLSFATLFLPKVWDPETIYPLYMHLHGLSSTTNLPMDYLTRYYLKTAYSSYAYEDGYLLMPWGRGNLWYQGISAIDIMECRSAFENMLKIDVQRQYLKGHSMGGYGAWCISSNTSNTWAALGIEAGALSYGNGTQFEDNVIQKLKNLPTYFVVGTNDGLLSINQQAYDLLIAVGNDNTKFVTFEGGHEHLDSYEELLYLWMKEFRNEDYTSMEVPLSAISSELQCYPNPFSETTTLSFNLDKSNQVSLAIYNCEGKLIKELVNNTLPKGYHEFRFFPTSTISGIYISVLKIDEWQIQHKLLITTN